ncbi:Ig-like domain-containing protein [Marinobacterium sp. YM272]|uniref:Ig-like domain-containing protein n=1 Tax=Marinobacterium sp. YM272 TaxID=3421654 RepID=UPI003D7FE442
MHNKRRGILAGAVVALMIAGSGQVLAEPNGNRFDGNPDNLPPGRLKSQIDKLPYAAQQRAIEWLKRLDIPAADFEFLGVDPEGGIYYEDTVLPDEVDETSGGASFEPQAVAPEDTFLLHSRPGAAKVVFLDFDGHVISGTAWNSGTTLYARAFDTDGDPSSFNDSERAQIAEIWHRVSEDMAPFDIDVTTEDPGSFGPTTGHVLITEDTDEYSNDMPAKGAGGVAYVGVWGRSYYPDYSPALVYANNLGPNFAPFIAEAASHEFGHNLGLGHDGTFDGITEVGYYTGHGSGFVSWAPIMGVGYYTNVTQWSQGEYLHANNTQDDVAIITGLLDLRPDDHGDSLAEATALAIDANGTATFTFPEIDPHNLFPANKGVIETRDDVDYFWFDTAEGYVTFNALPAWESYYRDDRRGANLDIELSLYDALGNWVTSADPLRDTMAQIDELVPAGRYYLAVTGVGNVDSPYSDYGSLGMYFISGTVQPADSDTTPPTPNPAGWWASAPAAQSMSSIAMTANPASDDSGVVQYYFVCAASSGTGCSDSGWQSGTSYVDIGLEPSANYSYQVKARDGAGNETSLSAIQSASTLANQLPLAQNDSADTDENLAVTVAVLANDSDPEGATLQISSYGQGSNGAVTQNGNSLVYTPAAGFFGVDSFTYTVSDGYDKSAPATVTVSVNEVNQPPVAVDDSANVALNATLTIYVLANDSDPDVDALSILEVTQGSKGLVEIVDGLAVSYTSGNKRGGDSFTYTVIDTSGNSATATVNISISPNGDSDGGSDGGGGDTGGGGKCHPKKGC